MTSSTAIPREPTTVTPAIPKPSRHDVADRSPVVLATHTWVPADSPAVGNMSLAAPHDPALCAGRTCSRHHPSLHHMRTWPRVWRQSYGYSDRMCPHGLGHPDPDDVVHLQALGGARTAHACDGCCIAPLAPGTPPGRGGSEQTGGGRSGTSDLPPAPA